MNSTLIRRLCFTVSQGKALTGRDGALRRPRRVQRRNATSFWKPLDFCSARYNAGKDMAEPEQRINQPALLEV